MIRTFRYRMLQGGLALVAAGCQDLNVVNPNLPDAARATTEPLTTESFAASSFRSWWPVAGHGGFPGIAMVVMSRDVTSGFADFGQLEPSTEPRTSWNNSEVNARRFVNQDPWYGYYRTISAATDVVVGINSGLVIVNPVRTARAKAMGKFMQGLSYGYLGLMYDKAVVTDERTQLDTIATPSFTPYPGVISAAIAQLDSAAVVANSQPTMTFPVENFLFQALTRDQFVRLTNSYAARLLAYSARTRTERANVNWAEVLRRIDAGILVDFAPVAQVDILVDDWKRLLARLRTAGRPSDYARPSYWLIGQADSTNGWQNWLATANDSRLPFQLRTRDRRIQGAAGPTAPGAYMGYNLNNLFAISRGSWRFSHYYFLRYGTGISWQTGPQPELTVVEMDLLRAEALIRLGRAAEAVPLINRTRTASGQLPPVTIDGPPIAPGCVPRKLNGTCGSLWDALRYEKGIELMGMSAMVPFLDARGWQTMPASTPTQFPIPGRELSTLRQSLYSFGGIGGESSTLAPDAERCPVTAVPLARCP